MPKELKKRGRREAKRQKLDHKPDTQESAHVSRGLTLATQAFVSSVTETKDANQLPFESTEHSGTTFYGILDEKEQDYFRKADEMLEANEFKNTEERTIFTQNVLKETENKELKMACSQSCSRLLEKLIILADPNRVKIIFQKFHGHFKNLLSHRFASHCCETLFTAAASLVTLEQASEGLGELGNPESYVSTENLFLFTVNDLESSIDSLLMDQFGSHVLRTLFLVLAGAPLESPSHKAMVHSKKKEKISLPAHVMEQAEGIRNQARSIPESFREALSRIINSITANINRESIRNLATHPLGSPTLQLLIELDLGRPRKYKTKIEESLVGKLLLQSPGDEERDIEATKSFVKMLMQDTIGSHVLEVVIFSVPKKTFLQLYEVHFKGQLGKLSVSETASFVVIKLLLKMDVKEFRVAEEELRAVLPSLVEHHRIAVIRSILETCNKHNISSDSFCNALFSVWGADAEVDRNGDYLLEMLEITPQELETLDSADYQRKEKKIPSQLHASLLVQILLTIPGQCSDRIKDGIASLPQSTLKRLCKHQTASHVVQKSLLVQSADAAYKRKLVGALAGSIADLAIHPIGSHIVDTLCEATLGGMKFYRQRIADELLASEAMLRDSFYGRAVWRNWRMDLYKTRRFDWNNSNTSINSDSQIGDIKKTAIQIASERHAAAKKVQVQEHGNQSDRKMKQFGGAGITVSEELAKTSPLTKSNERGNGIQA